MIYILCSDLEKLTALIGKSYFLSKSWPFFIYKQPSQHFFHDMLPLKNLHGALQDMYIEIRKHSSKNINGWTYLNCILMTTKTMVNVVINAQARIDVPLVLRFVFTLGTGDFIKAVILRWYSLFRKSARSVTNLFWFWLCVTMFLFTWAHGRIVYIS